MNVMKKGNRLPFESNQGQIAIEVVWAAHKVSILLFCQEAKKKKNNEKKGSL